MSLVLFLEYLLVKAATLNENNEKHHRLIQRLHENIKLVPAKNCRITLCVIDMLQPSMCLSI